MENKKNLKTILIAISIYMLLSWIIVSGSFSDGEFVSNGFEQFGLFDFILAPINLFNNKATLLVQKYNGVVNYFAYGNIVIAIIMIAVYYGILNKIDGYKNLVRTVSSKFKNNRIVLLYIITFVYYLISSLFGMNLWLLLFFPFVCAVFGKLKFNKLTIFTSTIGAILFGQIAAIFNPNINGLGKVLFSKGVFSFIIPKIILALILLFI